MTLQIKPGRNVWVLARTDRDAPNKADAEQTAAAWLVRVLGEGQEFTLPPGQDLPGDVGQRYYVGPARPLDLAATQTRPTLATAQESWRYEIDQDEALAVRAEHPWYVVADFDWRGPTKTLDQWPRRAINAFGIPVDEPTALDWLLLQASAYGEAIRPDSGFAKDIGPALGRGLGGVGLMVLAALLLLRR